MCLFLKTKFVLFYGMQNGVRNWHIGYCKDVIDKDTYIVEHLERTRKGANLKWRYPTQEDIQTVEAEQILNCEINGTWDILADRNMNFTLHNHKVIEAKFSKLV